MMVAVMKEMVIVMFGNKPSPNCDDGSGGEFSLDSRWWW